jgi:hypothetical protein
VAKNWSAAENWCQSNGANLMKVNNDDEYDLTYSFYISYVNGGRLWVKSVENIFHFSLLLCFVY